MALRRAGTDLQRASGSRAARRAALTALAVSVLSWPASALADSWSVGPFMTQQHAAGVSAELADGSVFVAGGDDTHPAKPVGELLAASGSGPFTPVGSMKQERMFPAGALLHNGDVLIAGGDDLDNESTPVPKTAELWSPASGGTFTPTGPMNVSRQVFALTTLPNGRALAVGGSPDLASGAGSATAELFNPATGRWTRTGSMPSGRLGHTATLLPDCRVLVVGDAGHAVTYNYVTGKFAVVGTEGLFKRSYHTATLLANGRVLVAGGEKGTQDPLPTASVWDPATGQFKPTANDMSSAHVQGFAARLPDGRVIVGGGFSTSASPPTTTDSVDIYNPATNRWSPAASLPSGSNAVSPEVEVLQNGEVVVMGIGQLGNGTAIYHPGPLGHTVSPPARNCANLTHPFVVHSVKVGPGHVLKVIMSVPESGRLTALATAQRWKTSTPKRWFSFGSARLNVSHPGKATLSVFPSARARTLLAHHHTLRVRVTTAYQPAVGPGKTTTVTIGIRGR
jgi:hypothetical protein